MQLTQTAGATLVALMATERWTATRNQVVALWSRARQSDAEDVALALDETREQVLLARERGERTTEGALANQWHGRLMVLLASAPYAEPDLERLVHEVRELLPPDERSLTGSLHMSAHATGNSRVYQAGRDQHITER